MGSIKSKKEALEIIRGGDAVIDFHTPDDLARKNRKVVHRGSGRRIEPELATKLIRQGFVIGVRSWREGSVTVVRYCGPMACGEDL